MQDNCNPDVHAPRVNDNLCTHAYIHVKGECRHTHTQCIIICYIKRLLNLGIYSRLATAKYSVQLSMTTVKWTDCKAMEVLIRKLV